MIAGPPMFLSPLPPSLALPAAQGPQIRRCRSGWSGFGPGKNNYPDQRFFIIFIYLHASVRVVHAKINLMHMRAHAHAVILNFILSLIFLFIRKNPDHPDLINISNT